MVHSHSHHSWKYSYLPMKHFYINVSKKETRKVHMVLVFSADHLLKPSSTTCNHEVCAMSCCFLVLRRFYLRTSEWNRRQFKLNICMLWHMYEWTWGDKGVFRIRQSLWMSYLVKSFGLYPALSFSSSTKQNKNKIRVFFGKAADEPASVTDRDRALQRGGSR